MFAMGSLTSPANTLFTDHLMQDMIRGLIGGAMGGILGAIVGVMINAKNGLRPNVEARPVSRVDFLVRIFLFVVLVKAISYGCGAAIGYWSMMNVRVPPEMTSPEQVSQFKVAAAKKLALSYLPILVPISVFISAFLAFGGRSKAFAIGAALSLLSYFGSMTLANNQRARPWYPFPVVAQPIAPAQASVNGMTPQQRAVRLFPDLAIANSKLNQEFVRRYKQYKAQNPTYFNNSEWPTQLARDSAAATGAQPAGAWSGPVLPLPRNGEIQTSTRAASVAPLEIRSAVGTNYLVKLVEVASGRAVMSIFVWGGSVINVKAPLGDYIVKYAAGDEWYGYRYLFGPETSYSQAETIFSFRQDGTRLTGYSITLYKVLNGNLQTRSINASEF